ncbi:MAG: integration host factor subunit alpha [Mariprofundaceae bacterium]|nr:integration host factor subunit alpha [Mariprofundaceae bacterium]
MTKADIAKWIHKHVGTSQKDAVTTVDAVLDIMRSTMIKGEHIKISGFGNFMLRDKHERRGRNPQTGDSMPITARRVVTFRASHLLKEKMNDQ